MPAFDNHGNFAYSTVATAPSPATSGTSLVVATGDGVNFPAAPFNATVWPVSSQPTFANAEIVRVTNKATDTLTITRAQEGTTAKSIAIGYQIANTITTKVATDLEAGYTGSLAFTADTNIKRVTITDANITTTSKIIISITRPNITESDDPGWIWIGNVVTQTNGSFDVQLVALEWDSPALSTMPNETITIVYKIWN